MDLLKQKEVEDLLKKTSKYKNSFTKEDDILKFIRLYGLKKDDFDGLILKILVLSLMNGLNIQGTLYFIRVDLMVQNMLLINGGE